MAFNYSPKIVTDGLVLYMDAANSKSYVSGSTTWNDISRSGNNGTLINGPTFNSSNGGSIVFDGTNDTTNLGNILNIGLNSWTISCWFKINSYTSGVQGIVGKTSARGYVGRYAILIESGLLYVLFHPTSPFLISTSVTPYNDGKWHNVVLSINRTGFMYMHVDGSSVGTPLDVSSTSGVNLNASTDNLYVGSYASDTGLSPIFFFNGNIAQTSIYNRALSQTEILQNYNSTKTRFGLT